MNTKIKNAIVGLSLGLFAVCSVNARPLECDDLRTVAKNAAVVLDYGDTKNGIKMFNDSLKAQGLNNMQRQIYTGMVLYLEVATEDNTIDGAVEIMTDACQANGVTWTLKTLHETGKKYMIKNNIK